MYQQCARYLVKAATALRAGLSIDEPMSYLKSRITPTGPKHIRSGDRDFTCADVQLTAFRHRAVRLIFESEKLLRDSQVRDHLSQEEAWNAHMMTLISAARAHVELFVLQSFVDKVALISDPVTQRVAKNLCDLFALVAIESPLSIGSIGFVEDGYIAGAELRKIRVLVHAVLDELSPEAIALTDSWNFSDASLQSALGRQDGNVYETLLRWTRQLPINRDAAKEGGVLRDEFVKYIQPILRGKL